MFGIQEHGPRAAPVCGHDPHIGLARAIRNESDLTPVRRIPRVHIERDAAALREALSIAADARDPVNMAQQVKHNPAAVGRYVDRHLRALLRAEVDGARGSRWSHDRELGAVALIADYSTGRVRRRNCRIGS